MPRSAERVRAVSQGLLEPGERTRRVMLAQGGVSPWWRAGFFLVGAMAFQLVPVGGYAGFRGALGGLAGVLLANAFTSRRVVLVTDRAVVVLQYGRFGAVKPTRVLARLPLGTEIGPLSGTWARIELAGEPLWVHRQWQGDAAAFVPPRLG
ncbi:hypothetical protein ACIHIX_17700 [Streptomyces sp. NPDC051913]|uniref:hypothetical protein n=1 Tax=Streptomyces sp. NPDC051913 TaxID=3365676 RepID=UPI0037CDA253